MVQIKDQTFQKIEELLKDRIVECRSLDDWDTIRAILDDLKAAKGGYGHGTRQA